MTLTTKSQDNPFKKSLPQTIIPSSLQFEEDDFDLADLIDVKEKKLHALNTPNAIANYKRALKGFPALQSSCEGDPVELEKRKSSQSRRKFMLKEQSNEENDLSVHIPDGKQASNLDDSKYEDFKSSFPLLNQELKRSLDQHQIQQIIRQSIQNNQISAELATDRKSQPDTHQDSINEIIVKVELKKFQNLIENKLKRKNNLTYQDPKRLFPLNKLADGSARAVQLDLQTKNSLQLVGSAKSNRTHYSKFKWKDCFSNDQIEEGNERKERIRTRQKSEVMGGHQNKVFLPSTHWVNMNFEDPQNCQTTYSIETPYSRMNASQIRQNSAVQTKRARQNLGMFRGHQRTNQSSNFEHLDSLNNPKVIRTQTGMFQQQINPMTPQSNDTLQINDCVSQMRVSGGQEERSGRYKVGSAIEESGRKKKSSMDLSKSKHFVKKLQSKAQRKDTNKSKTLTKEQIYELRMNQLKQNPKFGDLYTKFLEDKQKQKYPTVLAQILNEDFDEFEAQSALFKNSKKLQLLIGEISQKPVSKHLLSQKRPKLPPNPDQIDKLRQRLALPQPHPSPYLQEKLLNTLKQHKDY